MAFLDRVIEGFCPVIKANSSIAVSNNLMLFSEAAFPTHTLTTIFFTFGTRMTLGIFSFFINADTTSLSYFSFKIEDILLFLIQYLAAFFANADLLFT